jgi:hypothetical protein
MSRIRLESFGSRVLPDAFMEPHIAAGPEFRP